MPLKTERHGQNGVVTGLKLYTSNQLEKLASLLAGALDAPLGLPLAPEVIVVQSRGMARWTSLQLARICGICMDCEFPFPRVFIDRTLRAFFPEMVDAAEFSPGVIAWKINAMLPSLARRRELAPVKNYLEGDEGLKAFQLSEKIARLFDQYLVYRPEMLLRWERDAAEKDWQAVVWRELMGKKGVMHLAGVSESLGTRMEKLPAGIVLPERVSVFGISSLPPLYLRIFFELARHCEVNFFSLQPSMEYYGHDLSPKMKARLERKQTGREGRGITEHLETGNPLLTSLGKLNRDFTELRLEFDERAGFITGEQPEQVVEPSGDDMLAVIQGDILHASNRGNGGNPKKNVDAGDRSIQIHACHSPMREVEVLYDQLLDLFSERSVAASARHHRDDAGHREIRAVQSMQCSGFPRRAGVIFLSASRTGGLAMKARLSPHSYHYLHCRAAVATATEVFSLLDRLPVRSRFKFTDSDMGLIRRWIVETGIRWGIDGAHRTEFGLPELETTTWRAGFQRLLLGYAMVRVGTARCLRVSCHTMTSRAVIPG